MSGTALDVILEPRLGARKSERRQRVTIGSDVPVWFDVRDDLTGALVPGASGVSALYWMPGTEGADSAAQPLLASEVTPGTWRVLVPTIAPGTYTVWFGIAGPIAQTVEVVFDVSSAGAVTLTSTADWGAIQAAGAAAGASAGLGVVQGRIDTVLIQGLSHTLGLPAGQDLETINALDVTVTIPAFVIAPEHVGRMWTWLQGGLGVIKFVRADGRPLFHRLSHNSSAGQGASGALKIVWDNIGGVTVHLSGDTARLV